MSMKLQYVASSGRQYNLTAKGSILTREANYHTWVWNPVGTELQYGTRVAAFSKEAAVYTAVLVFEGSPAQRKAKIEDLHEDFEADIRNKTPGKIVWGDYYIECYITESSTTPDDRPVWTDNEISIYCPYPFWTKDNKRSFEPQTAPVGQTFLDYEFDYEYDYHYRPGSDTWVRTFPFASRFRMIVYGPCSNPIVMINGYPYQFFDTLAANEYVSINSRTNKIIKHLSDGTAVGIFNKRNKEQSIFEPIPGGTLTINWSGDFGFDLTIFEERSEPRWS